MIKTEVGNEMKIFIRLKKYNACQRREEGNPMLVVNHLISILGICRVPTKGIRDQ